MAQIFISYAREDEARIQPFVHALEAQGWSVFWDRRIPTGQTWRSYLGKALSDASCVVVAWSRDSIDSAWVSEEADEGKKRGILVPFLLDAVEPPIGFRSIQAADLSEWQPERPSPCITQLLHDIQATLHVTGTPPFIHQSAEPTPPLSRPPLTFMQRKLKAPSQHYTYYGAVIAITLVLVAGAGYWMYLDRGNARETVNRSTIHVQGGDKYEAQPQISTIDIQGTWRREDTRDLYTITQKGNSFEWTGGKPPGRSTTGTINGGVVEVNWPEECDNQPQRIYGKKSKRFFAVQQITPCTNESEDMRGRIVLGKNQRAKKIHWANSVVFTKLDRGSISASPVSN